jgi:hypothetical protein
VGLAGRVIEEAGIPTIGISIAKSYTEAVNPPRSVFLRWPFGHVLGEPFNIKQQRIILDNTLNALVNINTPGEILDLPFRWRRETYEELTTGDI